MKKLALATFDPHRKRRRGTDGAMARQFLAGKGHWLPQDYACARLVHLTDPSRAKELMVIFISDLPAQGMSADKLIDKSANPSRRREVEEAHVDRIRNTLAVIALAARN